METQEQKAILSIALLAAFADSDKADSEREAVRRLAESLQGDAAAADLASLYQDILLKRVDLSEAVAGLKDPSHRQLAYEMAVCVCDADGRRNSAETVFLTDLKARLGLQSGATAAFESEETALVDASEKSLATVPTVVAGASTGQALQPDPARDAELDQTIHKAALINGALELLPQSWASMAIIPLQVRMVYNIGKAHGIEMDQGHIKEFIATVGVGITSQYVEQFGRKLLGGLLGKVGGRAIGGIGSLATGMAMSFATTHALGQVAKRYYGGGRVMSTALLQETFQQLLAPAKQMQAQYLPQMKELSRTLDMGKVLGMIKGP